MNVDILEDRVRVGICLHGHFKVTIFFRGRVYSSYSNNTTAYDRLSCDITYKSVWNGYTYKGALLSLYNEVKRNHSLGEFACKFYF